MTPTIQALDGTSDAQAVNRTTSEKRQLTKVVGVRVDQETYDRWLLAAQTKGLSVPDLVRVCTDHLLHQAEVERTWRR